VISFYLNRAEICKTKNEAQQLDIDMAKIKEDSALDSTMVDDNTEKKSNNKIVAYSDCANKTILRLCKSLKFIQRENKQSITIFIISLFVFFDERFYQAEIVFVYLFCLFVREMMDVAIY